MREINLPSALDGICSSTRAGRDEGLADFEHIIKQSRQNGRTQRLSNDNLDNAFKTLFVSIERERAFLIQDGNSSKQRSEKARDRSYEVLTASAKAVRILCELSASSFDFSVTVRNVLDQIVGACRDDDGDFFDPLLENYFKALQAVLSHRPHLEHLPEKTWNELVKFCCDALRHAIDIRSGTAQVSQQLVLSNRPNLRSNRSSRAGTPAYPNDTVRQERSQNRSEDEAKAAKNRGDNLASCLDHLLSVNHVNVLAVADNVLSVVFDTLKPILKEKRPATQEPCFSVVNSILFRSITENVELAKATYISAVFHIRRMWHGLKQAPGLGDQMLIVLLRGQCLVPGITSRRPVDDSDELSDLEGLLDRLQSEYQDRMMNNMLQTADIGLSLDVLDPLTAPFSLRTFCVRNNNTAAESSWTQLCLMADLFNHLRITSHRDLSSIQNGGSLSSKRTKHESPLHSLVRSVTTSQREKQLAALHFLTFILATVRVYSVVDLQMLVENLFPLISKDNGEISSWAMLALSTVCHQEMAGEASLQDVTWLQIFQVSVTRLSSNRISRFACHLAESLLISNLVVFTDAADSLDGLLTSVDVSGPSGLSDAAVSFWKTILALYGNNRAASYEYVSGNVLRWLFGVWRPSQLDLRSSEASNNSASTVQHVIGLLQILVGEKIGSSMKAKPGRRVFSALSRAKWLCDENAELTSFLVAGKRLASSNSKGEKLSKSQSFEPQLSTKAKRSALHIAHDYLTSEVEEFLATQSGSIATEQLSQVNLRSSLAACIVSLALADMLAADEMSRSNQLMNQAIQLRDHIMKTFFRSDIGGDKLRLMCETLYATFQDLRILPLQSFKHMSYAELAIMRTARAFDQRFWNDIRERQTTDDDDLLDAVRVEDTQDTTGSRSSSSQTSNGLQRDWLSAYSDEKAYKNSIKAEMCLAGCLPDPLSLSPDDAKSVPHSIVEYLLSLDACDFLACRPFLDDIYASKLDITPQDGADLLAFLGTEIIESDDLERNETAIGTCLDLMCHLVHYWATTEMETATEMEADISHAAKQLYGHFMKVARKRMLTPHVQIKMAAMLQRLIKKSAAHGRSESLSTAKTDLFLLLEMGAVTVKYKISQNIAAIFGFFILRDHDAVLDDIEASIPHDPDSLEITAVRLSLLSRLASSWSTLIRRCVYAIVDATGLMSEVLPYACTCLQSLGQALGMSSLRELFRLFVPQILYTWLETRTIDTLPFSIFEYESLQEMAVDVRHEIASQIVMRGKEEEVETVTAMTGCRFNELLSEAFGKCAAYCIARDHAIAPEADPKAADAARRLRHHVGADEFSSLISSRFPEIVATFFKILDREDLIAKSFQKNPSHAAAQEAFEQMVASNASQDTPPVSQQPSFRSNCLIDELEYICQRSPYESRNLWSPPLYVFIFRGLLETIHPALGPLHAAAVIKRIRILVSMAGPVALGEYPLEMTLGSLREHLGNTHSAEDVMGLYKYLLKVGETYLSQRLSFLAGFIVSVLASLKALIEKPQESTTQESAFHATIDRAHEFHSWVTKYASSLDLSSETPDRQQSFRKMVDAASGLRSHGSANSDTSEGDLLYQLMHDSTQGQSLIDDVSRKEIVSLLCKDFKYSGDYRTDILGDGNVAAGHASAAVQLYGLHESNLPFNLWVLRVLGRSYASCGFVEPSFRREVGDRNEMDPTAIEESDSPIIASAAAIVCLLYQVSCSHSTLDAGVAERTVQSLLSKAVANNELRELTSAVPTQALAAMDWQIFAPPPLTAEMAGSQNLQDVLLRCDLPLQTWCVEVCQALISASDGDPFLSDLSLAVEKIDKFAIQSFPYIMHLILVRESGRQEQTKKVMSTALRQMMLEYSEATRPHVEHMINTIIYLRSQAMPFENTKMDRTRWLDVDYQLAAEVAVKCKMFKTALLFVEIGLSRESMIKGSRRSSAGERIDAPTDLLLQIFQNIEEKDYYHGVRQPASLSSMMERLDMEQAGFQNLSFRGAAFDIESRRGKVDSASISSLIRSLNNLELSSLSQAIATSTDTTSDLSADVTFDAARKLEKWDIPCPETATSPAVTLFKTFQSVQAANDKHHLAMSLDQRLQTMLSPLEGSLSSSSADFSYWSTLASIIEIEEVLTAKGPQQLQDTWESVQSRTVWLKTANSDHVERLLSSRDTLFSILNKSPNLQQLIKAPPKQTKLIQLRSLLESSEIHRSHGNMQKSLAATTAAEQLLPDCHDLGLRVEAAARVEVSNVMWDNREMASSIRILQDVRESVDFSRQDVAVSKPGLLARLARRVSEARLEQPDEILTRYLEPAVKELRGNISGDAAGEVFHEFAVFCDQQLQNPESKADFLRAQKLRDDKAEEIRELDEMIKSEPTGSKVRDNYKSYRAKAKQWYDLDQAEFKRLQNSRDILLKQSLENYMKCLKACDAFDRDAMRFSALWLEHHDDQVANDVVSNHLGDVSSRKFATLMNQWTSRLLDEEKQFQKLLSDLIYRICAEHPYHGMYNMFTSSKSKGGKDAKDAAAISRNAAANTIVKRLRAQRDIEHKWLALHNSCVQYVRFASEKPSDGRYRQGAKVLLERSAAGMKLQEVIGRMPPATMKIELRKDCNYRDVPVIVRWSREFSVASGISAPKVVTATASNGRKYKQLYKAGNDDLRQDAIMEQVFEQVSELLVSHRETRRRKLAIRSYKVLPLTTGTGIIEFVQNTIPINDYLVPAHTEHYPNDIRASAARKMIYDAAASRRTEHRIAEFRRVCDRMHPVLRFFFMERFENPDDWFAKRLNYTRTTAAVSMLGHIVGLGDRHGHNILLDEKTGEVVHIDLGIAFEQGRILPVPELVPFRLTRDIVDGFGATRTEGVFRRSCEFTLDALRREAYSIMTILEVLRYDPLVSWSLSPLRLKRLQEDKLNEDEDRSGINDGRIAGGGSEAGAGGAAGLGGGGGSDRPPPAPAAEKKENEEAEADRALTVVAKKLSRGLSVEATVNELIQQASDERNLALLFAGWAAYI